jgi:hypothetical protein
VAGRLIALALSAAVSAGAAAAAPPAAGPCFWVHGRLFAANGAPTFRIWPIGSKHILGVGGGEDPALPAPVRALTRPDAFKVDLYGDFRACPLTPGRPGRMQMVRIKAARRLVARPRRPD